MTNESIWEKVDLIEKRFENRLDKSNVKFNTLNPVWDNERGDALNVFEMIDELNYLNDCCNNLIDDNTEYVAEINQIHKENEELKQFKEKVFVLLDEKIKHYEHKPFSAPVGQPMSVNFDADVDRLARLSELQDLEKELQE